MQMAYLTPDQTNDSQASHPVITFRVNLETVDGLNTSLPNRMSVSGNEATSEAANVAGTRTIYLPGLIGNVEGIGPSGFLKHGDTFTVKGSKATYLKNTYVLGSSNDVLQIVE
jgi:hypothetical protein